MSVRAKIAVLVTWYVRYDLIAECGALFNLALKQGSAPNKHTMSSKDRTCILICLMRRELISFIRHRLQLTVEP
jgi:hypothetical protein